MMPNYNMKFGISEVARILKVNRDLVKSWAYHFSEYLKPQANPPKGTARIFTMEDLRVLAYVSMYWEDEPDLDSIKIGLNTDSHFEEPYNEFITTFTPFFQEPPENLDETWRHGTVIGGMAEVGDAFALAESYKLAGDILVEAALSKDEAYELIYPVIYNYRHATELYLKSAIQRHKKKHDLLWLLKEFKITLKTEFATDLPEWFNHIVIAFHDFDPRSTAFRYGGFAYVDNLGEVWVDLVQLKKLMGWLSESFQKIRHRRWTI